MVQLCADLEVEPTDVVLLVMAWKMHAATACCFTWEEFSNGMETLGCDSLPSLKAKLPQLTAELDDYAKFKDIYNYAYDFSRSPEQRSLGWS